ncbi:hypothetical protein ACVLD2_002812 [Paenibacillus sp. PvR052]|nr:hypothetical protein [Paenibacillus sp. PvP091]MBP1172416.1 hypothetical protein [Paenibacillus sp. PvR098]MBP2438797.1 hypothetical protein [Paenibacillus sp. PvP052]
MRERRNTSGTDTLKAGSCNPIIQSIHIHVFESNQNFYKPNGPIALKAGAALFYTTMFLCSKA